MQLPLTLRKGLRHFLVATLIAPFVWGQLHAETTATTTTTTPAKKSTVTPSTTTTPPAKPVTVSKTAEKTKVAPPSTETTTPPVEPGVTTLPPIVVTAATRDPQSIASTATTTTVLTADALNQAKFPSLAAALQSVPGLSVVTAGNPGGQTSVFIHGLNSNQTLVTVDGRRQPAGLSGANDNLANLTLDNVSQVEVVRTPISSIEGGSAMGGVINLVTLSGKGLDKPISSVSFEGGSFNSYTENVQSRGAVGKFDYAVSMSRQDSVYPALSPGDPANFVAGFPGQADQYRNTQGRANVGYQITPDIYVDLHGYYGNAYTSVPGQYVFPDPTANLTLEDWNISPGVVAKITDFYTTKLYYTHDQQRQSYVAPYYYYPGAQGYNDRTQINSDLVDWQNNIQIAHNWSITTGIQGDNHDYYQYDTNLGYRTFDGHDNNIGGYVSSQWQPLEGLNILNSGRYDSYSQFGGAFSWRQAVAYTVPQSQTELHASVSSAFTPPPLQDLVVSFPPYAYANPDLKPETDLGWEAGVAQPLWDGRITPSATYFHNNLHDTIQPVGTTVENIGQATTDGVEVGLEIKPSSTVTVKLNYTYLNAVNDTNQTRLVRRPRNSFDFTGTWQPIEPLVFTLGGNWVVGRQDINPNFPYNQIQAPDYFVLRASASYKINEYVSIWVRGENLTDAHYEAVLGYYSPSLAAYGGLRVTF